MLLSCFIPVLNDFIDSGSRVTVSFVAHELLIQNTYIFTIMFDCNFRNDWNVQLNVSLSQFRHLLATIPHDFNSIIGHFDFQLNLKETHGYQQSQHFPFEGE